jgi:hypothetical protein
LLLNLKIRPISLVKTMKASHPGVMLKITWNNLSEERRKLTNPKSAERSAKIIKESRLCLLFSRLIAIRACKTRHTCLYLARP